MDARLAEFQAEVADEEWDGYAMSNLRPADTGLPMVVWVQNGEGVRHDVRVEVSMVPGDRISKDDLAVVAVRPEPRLLHGVLSRRDLDAVVRWVTLNEAIILDYWSGVASTGELYRALQKV
jgi:hypothetical protein